MYIEDHPRVVTSTAYICFDQAVFLCLAQLELRGLQRGSEHYVTEECEGETCHTDVF